MDNKVKKRFNRIKSSKSHMCGDIQGMLNHFGKGRKKLTFMTRDDGTPMGHNEAIGNLKKLQFEGKKLIKSEGCYRFDPYDKGCLGHITSLNPNDEKMLEIENEWQQYLLTQK